MSEIQFINLARELLSEIQNNKEVTSDKVRLIHDYILKNSDKECVRMFIYEFVGEYIKLVVNPDLIAAFNIPDNLYYYRQIQIYRNLPYSIRPSYGSLLSNVLQVPSEVYGDIYRILEYVVHQYAPNTVAEQYMRLIIEFLNQNIRIKRGSQSDYSSLEEEKARAKGWFSKKELEEFAFSERIMDLDKARSSFINKRIGNIGEIYAYELFRNYPLSCFVARDVKNGFGYDIYFLDEWNVENLVEVKTTMACGDDDYFSVSENEFYEMQRCVSNPYARYVICRVRLDSSLNPQYIFLEMSDQETLIDMNNAEIQYKLFRSSNGSFWFKRIVPNRSI